MALALPAESAPPKSVATVRPKDGIPLAATTIAASVVPSSSTVTCGFMRLTYAPNRNRQVGGSWVVGVAEGIERAAGVAGSAVTSCIAKRSSPDVSPRAHRIWHKTYPAD